MLRTVAIETSEKSGSLALLEDERPVDCRRLDPQRRTTQTLAVALRDALAAVAWQPGTIDLVAVTSGPGSFTGLRVAVTAAKTLAYVAQAAIVGVNTLEVIAAAAPTDCTPIWSVIDAQRGQIYAARFARQGVNSTLKLLDPTTIWDLDRWLQRLAPNDYVTGSALAKIAPRLPADVTAVDQDLWTPRAAWLARLAVARYRAGQCDDLWTLLPQYFRKSAAEEKLEANDSTV